ncbi:MAG: prolipoprotein diacylglyceryl transferase [Patescibacteria group bacterium]|jgi:prolipoprotein diacylglyceryl transferase
MSLLTFFHTYLPSPIITTVGALQLHWYGFFYLLSFLVGYGLLVHRLQKLKAEGNAATRILYDRLPGFAAGLIVSGIIGARLYHVATQWSYYQANLSEIPFLNHGGLAIHGGLLAGAIYIVWFSRRHLQPYLKPTAAFLFTADLLAPVVLLGQAIGRWGNYFNQELFGLPTSLPWGIPIALTHRPVLYTAATHFHPVFFYEFLWDILGAAVLFLLQKIKSKRTLPGNGHIFSMYLIWMGLGRTLVELLRIEPTLMFFDIRIHLLTAIALTAAGIAFFTVAQMQNRTV